MSLLHPCKSLLMDERRQLAKAYMDVHFPFDKEADGVTPFSLCCVCIFKVGTSEWTTSPEPGAGSCFPRCTWRRAEASCLVSRPWWNYRPTTLGRAATGKHTVKSLCKNFAVSRETEREKKRVNSGHGRGRMEGNALLEKVRCNFESGGLCNSKG